MTSQRPTDNQINRAVATSPSRLTSIEETITEALVIMGLAYERRWTGIYRDDHHSRPGWHPTWEQYEIELFGPLPRGLKKHIREVIQQQREKLRKREDRKQNGHYRVGYYRGRGTARVWRHGPLANWAMSQERLEKILRARYRNAAMFAGNTKCRDKGELRYIAEYDPKQQMALVLVDRQWCQYTRSYGHFVGPMAGLVIRDRDTGEMRFLRVPPATSTIDEALEAIMPAAVRRAVAAGVDVPRQGDFYFVPQRTWNLRELERTNHTIAGENGSRTIQHPHHPVLTLNAPHRAYQQILTANGLFGSGGGGRGHAD